MVVLVSSLFPHILFVMLVHHQALHQQHLPDARGPICRLARADISRRLLVAAGGRRDAGGARGTVDLAAPL